MHDCWLSVPEFLPTASEMLACDRKAIAAGISSQTLMERAGEAIAGIIERQFPVLLTSAQPLILCGPGNNGGDGLVIARLLESYHPRVVITGSSHYSEDHLIQRKRLEACQIPYRIFSDDTAAVQDPIGDEELLCWCQEACFIIDALLGTGQKEAPRGNIELLLKILHAERQQTPSDRMYLSVDTPTGVNTDTGVAYDYCFEAKETICIEAIKRGLLQYPARQYAGRIQTVSIGIALEDIRARLITAPSVKLHTREATTHKGRQGSVMVIAGSQAMPGASTLAARAALRSGAGLVFKAMLSLAQTNDWPELMYVLSNDEAVFTEGWFNKLTIKTDCYLIGPGLKDCSETDDFVLSLLKHVQVPLVLDATALHALSRLLNDGKLSGLSLSHLVLTPHPGEAAALLGCTNQEVQKDRYAAIQEIVERTQACCVLKGAATLIAAPGEPIAVIPYGNPYMATAGSGDVLSGVIAAFVASPDSNLYEASFSAAYIHARCGDRVHRCHGGPLIAGDLISELPWVIGETLSTGTYD